MGRIGMQAGDVRARPRLSEGRGVGLRRER